MLICGYGPSMFTLSMPIDHLYVHFIYRYCLFVGSSANMATCPSLGLLMGTYRGATGVGEGQYSPLPR